MRVISGLLRILLGFGIMGFAGYVYLMRYDGLSSGQHVIVSYTGQAIDIGHANGAEAQTVIIGIAAAGLIGLLLFSAGIVTLLRKPAAPTPTGQIADRQPSAASP